jgi:hypothetical protein
MTCLPAGTVLVISLALGAVNLYETQQLHKYISGTNKEALPLRQDF